MKKVKKQPKNYTKKTGNFLDWDFGIWPKRDGFRDILAHYNYPPFFEKKKLAIFFILSAILQLSPTTIIPPPPPLAHVLSIRLLVSVDMVTLQKRVLILELGLCSKKTV